MPRDSVEEVASFDPASLLPRPRRSDRHLARMLPYVSLVDDVTVRTRGNELFQCVRLDGLNSATAEDELLDRTKSLFAQLVAQVGPGYAFYVHKVRRRFGTSCAPSRAVTSPPRSTPAGGRTSTRWGCATRP